MKEVILGDGQFPLALKEKVDDSTQVVTIETPDDWKCERKGCQIEYKHTHTTFKSLE